MEKIYFIVVLFIGLHSLSQRAVAVPIFAINNAAIYLSSPFFISIMPLNNSSSIKNSNGSLSGYTTAPPTVTITTATMTVTNKLTTTFTRRTPKPARTVKTTTTAHGAAAAAPTKSNVDSLMNSAADSLIEDEFMFQWMLLKQQDAQKMKQSLGQNRVILTSSNNKTVPPASTTKPPPPPAVVSGNELLLRLQSITDNMPQVIVNISRSQTPPSSSSNSTASGVRAIYMSSPSSAANCSNNAKLVACNLLKLHNSRSLYLSPISVSDPLMSKTRDSPYFIVSEACLEPTSITRRRTMDICQLLKVLQYISIVSESMAQRTQIRSTNRPLPKDGDGNNNGQSSVTMLTVQNISLDDMTSEFLCGTNDGTTSASDFDMCDAVARSCEEADLKISLMATTTTTAATNSDDDDDDDNEDDSTEYQDGSNSITSTTTRPKKAAPGSTMKSTNNVKSAVEASLAAGNNNNNRNIKWYQSRKCGIASSVGSPTSKLLPNSAAAAASGASAAPLNANNLQQFTFTSSSDIKKIQSNLNAHYSELQTKLRKYLKSKVKNGIKPTDNNALMNASLAIIVATRTSRNNWPTIIYAKPKRKNFATTSPPRPATAIKQALNPLQRVLTQTSGTPHESYDDGMSWSPTSAPSVLASSPEQLCAEEVRDLAATLIDMKNNGSIWLSWFVLEDQIYGRGVPNVDASPLSTVFYSLDAKPAPLYLSVSNATSNNLADNSNNNNNTSTVCVPAITMRHLINAAMTFYKTYGQPFYVQSIVGSPAYNGTGLQKHETAIGVDLQCGQIYDASLGIDCAKLTGFCYSGPFKQTANPAYNIGCGQNWWPIDTIHCAD